MAQYIDNADILSVMKQGVIDSLFTDSVGGSVDSDAKTRCIRMASTLARQVASNAGTPLDDDNTPGNASDGVKILTLTVFVRLAYARGGESPPEDLLELLQGYLEATWTGDIPLVDETVDAVIGIGGVDATEAVDSNIDGAIVTVMDGLENFI